jgi:hypothetical protein
MSFSLGPPIAANTTSCDSRAFRALSKAACVSWEESTLSLSHSHSHAHPVRRMNVLEGDRKRSEIVIYTGTYVGIKIQKKPLFLNYWQHRWLGISGLNSTRPANIWKGVLIGFNSQTYVLDPFSPKFKRSYTVLFCCHNVLVIMVDFGSSPL